MLLKQKHTISCYNKLFKLSKLVYIKFPVSSAIFYFTLKIIYKANIKLQILKYEDCSFEPEVWKRNLIELQNVNFTRFRKHSYS